MSYGVYAENFTEMWEPVTSAIYPLMYPGQDSEFVRAFTHHLDVEIDLDGREDFVSDTNIFSGHVTPSLVFGSQRCYNNKLFCL
ncbi:MAG: hypothetical protein J4473_06075 [Candidatus Aenigmarchaeota archaeon]|nr:hypothetical protein [Candidatus Aenigmarchaeota archaeon]